MGRVKKKKLESESTEEEHNWGKIKSAISGASLFKSEPEGLSIVGNE